MPYDFVTEAPTADSSHMYQAAVASGGSKNPQKKVAEMIAMLTPSASTAGAASGSENDKDVRSDRRKEEAADATPQAGATMDQGQKLSKLSLEELRGMSVRQLKGVLVARQVDCVDMVEKEDLVQECLSQPAPIHATFRLSILRRSDVCFGNCVAGHPPTPGISRRQIQCEDIRLS